MRSSPVINRGNREAVQEYYRAVAQHVAGDVPPGTAFLLPAAAAAAAEAEAADGAHRSSGHRHRYRCLPPGTLPAVPSIRTKKMG